MGRLFGTDGVRGVANRDLTPDLAYKLGYAGAMVLTGEKSHKPTILIGSDTRISCDMLEAALSAGICAAGADVMLCGVVPTPAVAYLTIKYKCDAGVVISASHNSFEYNGIKFFSSEGFKLPDDTEDKIEALVKAYAEDNWKRPEGGAVGRRINKPEAAHEYVEHLKRRLSVDLSSMKVALDCANGASSALAPGLFSDLGAEVITIGNRPDGININANCGSTHLKGLQELVVREKCDIGLAFDGDADRLLVIDENGQLVDGDAILAIVGMDMKQSNELKKNTIVVTVMSNLGLDIMASQNGLDIVKTKVGDRYVLENMLANGYNIGGEQSGHVILLDHCTTGDGMLTALAFLRVLTRKNEKVSDIAKIIHVLPQVLRPARLPEDKKAMAMADESIKAEISKMEAILDGKGRILVRPSGTEPMIRVMIEGEDYGQIEKMADSIAEMIMTRYS